VALFGVGASLFGVGLGGVEGGEEEDEADAGEDLGDGEHGIPFGEKRREMMRTSWGMVGGMELEGRVL
jgi:hypothetical protein